MTEELLAIANRIEKLAFQMRPPNPWTPQFVELAIGVRAAAQARSAELEKALNASIAANELVLAQLKGGSDLSAEQVAKTLNAALDSARAALSGDRE